MAQNNLWDIVPGFDGPTWIEDPTPAIMAIKVFVLQRGELTLDKVRERLTKVREETSDSIKTPYVLDIM